VGVVVVVVVVVVLWIHRVTAILTQVFRSFPQSLQVNVGKVGLP
jgi:hypothetical protein